jgi:hypothetical protein
MCDNNSSSISRRESPPSRLRNNSKSSSSTTTTNTVTMVSSSSLEPQRPTSDPDDPIGEAVLEFVLNWPSQETTTTSRSKSEEPSIPWTFPLISRQNCALLQERVGMYWNEKKRTAAAARTRNQRRFLPRSILIVCSVLVDAWRQWVSLLQFLPGSRQHRPGLRSCVIFGFMLYLASSAVLSAGTALLVIVSTKAIVSLAASVLAFLIDTKELDRYWTPCQRVYQWIDCFILQGRRYANREWNRTNYSSEESFDAYLVELPPPIVGEHSLWGKETAQHVVAIQFCYSSLHNDEKERKKRRKSRKLASKSASMPLSLPSVDELDEKKSGDGDVLHVLEELVEELDDEVAVISSRSSHTATLGNSRELASPHEAIEIAVHSHRRRNASCSPSSPMDALMSPDSERVTSDDEYSILHTVEDDVDAGDLPWIDVGKKIGLRLLHSEHIQRAMTSQETKDRILETMGNLDKLQALESSPNEKVRLFEDLSEPMSRRMSKPMHSMWTSPEAAARLSRDASPLLVTDDDPMACQSCRSLTCPMSPSRIGDPNNMSDASFPYSVDDTESPTKSSPCKQGNRQSFVLSNLPPSGATGSPAKVAKKRHALSDTVVANLPLTAKSRTKRLSTVGAEPKRRPVTKRKPLMPGVKVALPLFARLPGQKRSSTKTAFLMASVVSSERIFVGHEISKARKPTNCLSIKVKLEKFFLRNGEFAEMNVRVMDEWVSRYMPRHSKVPIGSCVATIFGVGVLVGWRVEDDCHVVRSLWQRRGPGSSHAYLNRRAILCTVEASVGFRVQTMFGWGIVKAYTNYKDGFKSCKFLVEVVEEGRHKGDVFELDRNEIISCPGAQFMPVIEHVREAALYQIQVDNYHAALREQRFAEVECGVKTIEQEFLIASADCGRILWESFLKAVEEDKDFDQGVNEFMTTIIDFLNRLDQDSNATNSLKTIDSTGQDDTEKLRFADSNPDEIEIKLATSEAESKDGKEHQEPGFWIMNDLFGGIFKPEESTRKAVDSHADKKTSNTRRKHPKPSYFDRTFAVLRTVMKTVSIARAASVDYPHFRLALAISYDFLLFVRTIAKIQQRNDSEISLEIWKCACDEIVTTFGPLKERLVRIARGIATRMENQGRKAKIRIMTFADRIISDERLVVALEQGEWDRCLSRLEAALVEAEVIEESNLVFYHKAANFVVDHVRMALKGDGVAASRNNEKLEILAFLIQSLAAPRRSILKFFCRDDMLELFERILVRAYNKEEVAIRMMTIHASNFDSLRHLRMLKDFSVAGRIWIPLLDAADEEFSWLVSHMPENSKSIMCPLSSLFSLCVAQFHKINAGDFSRDWLAFLLEDESVRIVHDLDMKLILALQSFARDVREMMTVLPYYPRYVSRNIDDDSK